MERDRPNVGSLDEEVECLVVERLASVGDRQALGLGLRLVRELLVLIILSALCGASVAHSHNAAMTAPAPAAHETESVEAVVLLHGLGRTHRAMRPLERNLERAGYVVHNLRYDSTGAVPDELIEFVATEIEACCSHAATLHFVGHSLGGILIRAYLAESPPPNLGRVVMLAPPNHGSEIVDEIGDWAIFRWVLGPTAQQLGTDHESLPNQLPPPDYDLGIISGTATLNPIGSRIIPGEDDGIVSVETTKLDGMKDHLVVSRTHTFIMRADDIAAQVVYFLRHGGFQRQADGD
jgi:triacylglycerol lipase